MPVRNFLTTPLEDLPLCHEGEGVLKHVSLFTEADFRSKLRFFNYTILPPGTSIGLHQHGDDEELYVILEGEGIMAVDGETKKVTAGDVILNGPFGSHGLANASTRDLRILVFDAAE